MFNIRCERAKGALEVFDVKGKYLVAWIVHLGCDAMGVACMSVMMGAAAEVGDNVGLTGGIAGPCTRQRQCCGTRWSTLLADKQGDEPCIV